MKIKELLDITSEKKVWGLRIGKLYIEIVHWGFKRERPDFKPLNNGKGCWNYYVTVFESSMSKEQFEKEFWLEDKPIKYFESSPWRITHDYESQDFAKVNWHGGVTYYKKEGHTVGHRYVTIGCDYSHLFDKEKDYDYSIEDILLDAYNTTLELMLSLT